MLNMTLQVGRLYLHLSFGDTPAPDEEAPLYEEAPSSETTYSAYALTLPSKVDAPMFKACPSVVDSALRAEVSDGWDDDDDGDYY